MASRSPWSTMRTVVAPDVEGEVAVMSVFSLTE